jgi:hypothetical protein
MSPIFIFWKQAKKEINIAAYFNALFWDESVETEQHENVDDNRVAGQC